MKTTFLLLIMFIGGCNSVAKEPKRVSQKDISLINKSFAYSEANRIPICPYCRKPTERSGKESGITCVYYAPIYDENGRNTNPDRNTITSAWYCSKCGRNYTTVGNPADGYRYCDIANEANR